LPTVRPIVRRFGGAAVTRVLSLLALFEPSGSLVASEASGRRVIGPLWPRPVRTATSIEAPDAAASEPAAHVTVLPSLVHWNSEPSVCAAPTRVVPAGIGIATRGWAESEGPLFCTRTW
jgi:hypothetical protein